MAPAEAESSGEKYGVFLKLFHPEVNRLIRRPEQINDKIGRQEVSVLFNQTHAHTHTHTHTHIYITFRVFCTEKEQK